MALLPFAVTLILVLAAVLLILLALGVLAAPVARRMRMCRVAAFGLAYCAMEVAVLARGLGRPRRADGRLLVWALGMVLGAARRTLGFSVEVERDAEDLLGGDEPVLVLARHGGPGDSFSLVYLLEALYGRSVRIVAKDILQLDPAIDLLLNARGSCFVESSSRGLRNADRMAACTLALGEREALLLFPEGENWTPRRRSRAIRRLRARRRHRAANAAELMDNVLPPRPIGVAACLQGRPGIRVVIAAHIGLDRIVSARQLWAAIPFDTPMTVRFWPAQTPPGPGAGEDAIAQWLTGEWAIVDEWIDSRRDAVADQPSGRLVP
ncbi:MAG TPA: 1-acyl-sn-glycerol-3-phosphate acyltransferase [Acidimicrobiales bacterium]|nr:1-acyl-sn-glycerol-3-phosphate acyltransferase [Acidimicrobiales bacterium]